MDIPKCKNNCKHCDGYNTKCKMYSETLPREDLEHKEYIGLGLTFHAKIKKCDKCSLKNTNGLEVIIDDRVHQICNYCFKSIMKGTLNDSMLPTDTILTPLCECGVLLNRFRKLLFCTNCGYSNVKGI